MLRQAGIDEERFKGLISYWAIKNAGLFPRFFYCLLMQTVWVSDVFLRSLS